MNMFLSGLSSSQLCLNDAFIGVVVVSTVVLIVTLTVTVIVLCLKRNVHKRSDNFGNPQDIYEDVDNDHQSGTIDTERNEAYIKRSASDDL
jgi:hypothetical protein